MLNVNFDFFFFFLFRERKREREREDLWKKLETLSLNNARKEGISLDLVRIYFFAFYYDIVYYFIYNFTQNQIEP